MNKNMNTGYEIRKRIGKKAAGLAVALLLALSPLFCSGAEQQTLLVYMLACDLESDSGAATEDLHELMRSSVQASGSIRIFAYIGGSRELWFPELDHGKCYDLAFLNGSCVICRSLGTVRSAEEESLLRFLKAYGSDGACLIVWGHGNTDTGEIGFDDLYGHGTLTLDELAGAIRRSGFRFRLIGLDACGLATTDVFLALSPFAEIIAASPTEEQIHGWHYAELVRLLEKNDSASDLMDGLRNRRRDPDNPRLTVLNGVQTVQETDTIRRILNYTAYGNYSTLNEAAAVYPDREASQRILALLDGQVLMAGSTD